MQVSIAINNHNYGSYVGDAIRSALAQTYPGIEVIVVDDGSTDDSHDVIAQFGDSIVTVWKDNGGQASALNAGFARSRGEIVLFLDADDVLHPDCVEKVVAAWRPEFTKLHFNLDVIDAQGRSVGRLYSPSTLPRGDMRQRLEQEGTVASMPMSGNAFGAQALGRIMPMPEPDWRRSADVYLFNMCALLGETGAIDEPLGSYRSHGVNGSLMIKNRKLDPGAIGRVLLRDMRTDRILTEQAPKAGIAYLPGKLTGSLAHLQQLFLYQSVFGPLEGYCGPRGAGSLGRCIRSIAGARGVPAYKKIIIAGWTLGIALAPRRLTQRLVLAGYRSGFVFGISKLQARATS